MMILVLYMVRVWLQCVHCVGQSENHLCRPCQGATATSRLSGSRDLQMAWPAAADPPAQACSVSAVTSSARNRTTVLQTQLGCT